MHKSFATPSAIKLLWLGLLGVCGCQSLSATHSMRQSSTKPPVESAAGPRLRLGDVARPTHYSARLKLMPSEDHFSGSIDIDVILSRRTSVLWLHAVDLDIERGTVTDGLHTVQVRPIPGEEGQVGLSLERAVGPGTAQLSLSYSGRAPKLERLGLHRQEEAGDWYLVSDFEPTYARRAFPCFDEPSYRAPWQLTLEVPKEDLAFSNTQILSQSEGSEGFKVLRFRETPPLPSYLIALAVGPFDVYDAGTAGKKKTPLRIITPRGRASRARFAAGLTPHLVNQLEEYFGTSYPFDKLDLVAAPLNTSAMENPGLVIFGEYWLLSQPDEESVGFRRTLAEIAAHELAHMWFGNLVTAAWWDDIWLNEGFATWMATRTLEHWKPDWEHGLGPIRDRAKAMREDAKISARRVRQPIESRHDIANAFDSVTYDKGAAVLAMLESWIGEERFQLGIQRYLSQRAWGNATATNFFDAVDAVSGRNIAPVLSTFVDQTGIPLVTFELKCRKGERPKLLLSQQRYLPLGSDREGASSQTWQIPICVRFGGEVGVGRACTLLTGPSGELNLAEAQTCPAWVHSNSGGIGYYRSRYRGDLLQRLEQHGLSHLTTPERVAFLGDLEALVYAGELDVGYFLQQLTSATRDSSRGMTVAAIDSLRRLRDKIVSPDHQDQYAQFVEDCLAERARRLGWHPRLGEDEDSQLLRTSMLPFVADAGGDAALRAEAENLAREWLDGKRRLDSQMLYPVMSTAAHGGDLKLLQRFRDMAARLDDRRTYERLVIAMGEFRKPEVLNTALTTLFFSDQYDPVDALLSLLRASQYPEGRETAYRFLSEHFDHLVSRLPSHLMWLLTRSASSFCDESHRAAATLLFSARSPQLLGMPRDLTQLQEDIRLCIAVHTAQEPKLSSYLKKYNTRNASAAK